jgi:hypothetical protein
MMMTTMTMTTIDYEYYLWLTKKIDIPNGKSYLDLFERMHNAEFFWTVPNDDNRVQDGIDLRGEFLEVRGGGDLNLQGATCLEVVVGLSRRLAFIADGGHRSAQWAWTLLKNLRLHKFSDPLTPVRQERVDEILYNVVWRNYHPDGRGGFFPLQNPDVDQTKIEIWHQLNAYVSEMTDL